MPILNKFEEEYPTYRSFVNEENITLSHWYLYPLMMCEWQLRHIENYLDKVNVVAKRYLDKHPEFLQDGEMLLGLTVQYKEFIAVWLSVENSNIHWRFDIVDNNQLDSIVNEIAKFDAIPFTLENVIESFEFAKDIDQDVLEYSANNIETIINQIASPDNVTELLKINHFINKYTCSSDICHDLYKGHVNKQISKALNLIENDEPLTIVFKNCEPETNEILLKNLTEPVIKTITKYKNFKPSIEISHEMMEHIRVDNKPLSAYMGVIRRSLPTVNSIDEIPEDAVVVNVSGNKVLRAINDIEKPCDYLIVDGIFQNNLTTFKNWSKGIVKRNIFSRC